MYREFQQRLLDNELSTRRKSVEDLNTSVKTAEDLRVLKSLVNRMDYAALSYHISCRISKFTDNVQSTHEQKLMKLGASLDLSSSDPSKVVFNYSDRQLSDRETFLETLGLISIYLFLNLVFINTFYQLKNCCTYCMI